MVIGMDENRELPPTLNEPPTPRPLRCWPVDAQPKLAAALAKARGLVEGVAKDAKVIGGGPSYAYASSETVIREALRCLSEAGVSFTLDAYRIGPDRAFHVKQKGSAARIEIVVQMLEATYRLEHVSGEWREVFSDTTAIMCDASRPPDKAVGAAKTYDLSYALRTLLCMPKIEDEPDRRDDSDWHGHGQQHQGSNVSERNTTPAEEFSWPVDIDDARARRQDPDDRAEAWNQLLDLRARHNLPRKPSGTATDPVPRTLGDMDLAIETILSEHADESAEPKENHE